MKKKGFTLVELLAVIVILAIILLIAVPKISKITLKARVNAIASTTKLLARKIETKHIEHQIIEKDVEIDCNTLVKLDDNYEECEVKLVNEKGYAKVTGAKKFAGITCKGTKDNVVCNNGIETDLTVELNGGSTNQTFESAYIDGAKIELEDPTREDYQFNGWEVVRGNSVIENKVLTIGTENTTIYALWGAYPRFEIDADGGITNQTFESNYLTGEKLELESPKKAGYGFSGWEIIEGNSILSGNTLTIGTEYTKLKAIYTECVGGTYNDGTSSSCSVCSNSSNVATWSNQCTISTCNSCNILSNNTCNPINTLYVSSSGNDSNSGGVDAPFATIAKAYTCPGDITIKLLSNITQSSQANFNTANKSVTLTSNSGTYTITRDSGLTSAGMIALSNGGTLAVTNINFDGNNVSSTSPLISASNGSTVNLNSGTTIQKSINTNEYGASGVYINSSTLNVDGATLTNNNANTGVVRSNSGTINIISGTLSNNTSDKGGAIFVEKNAIVNIKGGTISNNTSTNGGGGLYINESTINVSGGNITGNTAGTNGGGIYTHINSTFTMTGGTISSNKANNGYGGGVQVHTNSEATITNGTISNNSAVSGGGGLYIVGATVNINGGNITGNNSKNGGGVYTTQNATLNIKGGSITNNTATSSGGGAYISKSTTLDVKAGSINNNTANSSGGGVYANESTINVSGGSINGNTASKYAGGVYLNSTSVLTITNGTISSNKANNNSGGGVYVGKSTLNINGGTISSNTAKTYGGAAYCGTDSSLNFRNGSVINNTATSSGGGIAISSTCTYSKTGGTLSGNTP